MSSERPQLTDLEKDSYASSLAKPLDTASAGETIIVQDPYEVTLEKEDDPRSLPIWRRHIAAFIVIAGAICVTGASSMAATAELGVSAEFHVSNEVATLSVTLFTLGLGLGPMIIGPLAAILGTRLIYVSSFALLFALTFPVAFSRSIAVHMIFRFLGGLCGSAFLSIGGATINELYTEEEVGTPMAAYTIGTFIGPVMTPIWCGFVFQRAGWRWLYYVLIIWVFVQDVALLLGVPETNTEVILKAKAKKLRAATGDDKWHAAAEKEDKGNLVGQIGNRILGIFQLILYDRMALLLDLWLSLILGILYLVFQVFPIIFGEIHGFNAENIGLSFLGVFTGLMLAMASQPFWNRHMRKVVAGLNGDVPPETWLIMGKIGGVIIPISLYCLAFTTYANVHWIAPIICSVPFGIGICYVYTSTFTYLVTAFRPMAAEALTGNAIMRTTFAATFPLFSTAMYHTLGTVGATALLAGLMTLTAPLPFIFDHIGERLREKSPYAYKSSHSSSKAAL